MGMEEKGEQGHAKVYAWEQDGGEAEASDDTVTTGYARIEEKLNPDVDEASKHVKIPHSPRTW